MISSCFGLLSRLFEAGQDELLGTELLIQRQEELQRLQARLSRASIYPGEDPRTSMLDLAEPLHSSPLETSLHPRKSKVMQGCRIQIEFALYKLVLIKKDAVIEFTSSSSGFRLTLIDFD